MAERPGVELATCCVCRPATVLDCAETVVSAECGAEIAGTLRALGTKVMTEFGCEVRKRAYKSITPLRA